MAGWLWLPGADWCVVHKFLTQMKVVSDENNAGICQLTHVKAIGIATSESARQNNHEWESYVPVSLHRVSPRGC